MSVNVSSSSLLLHIIYRQRKPETKSSLGDKTQNNTPKKIRDRSLDPKKYRACKFSTQKKYVGPPRHVYFEYPPPPPPPPPWALLSSYNQIFREIIEILNKQLFQKEIASVSRSWKDENDKELPNLPFYASNYDTSEVCLFVLSLVGIFFLLRI